MSRSRRARSRGAALVEFGLIAPVLFLLLFGVVEFGWAFVQYLDVRHGAREGARLAAVNYGTLTGSAQTDEILLETCSRMDDSGATLTLSFVGGTAPYEVGDEANIRVTSTLDTLTGVLDSFLAGVVLESDVEIRLEQDATWTAKSKVCP